MKVLFTGGSSKIGSKVLENLTRQTQYSEIWCTVHKNDISLTNPKIKELRLNLSESITLPAGIDLVIHFAGITHASDEKIYWKFNHEASTRLMNEARKVGCRRFVYISTRCATAQSGAYGESKLAFENELLKCDWKSLIILRPAEIYGGGGTEGIDKFISLARQFHLVPMLFGHPGISFSPLDIEDFIYLTSAMIAENKDGIRVVDFCGPEKLSGLALAARLSRRFFALPIPLWWPAFNLILRMAAFLGFPLVKPDQLTRLVGPKTASVSSDPRLLDVILKKL